MQYLVAFDPQLGLSAAEFVSAWNAGEGAAAGAAAVSQAPRETFLGPEATVALISAAASIPATVIATFVSEYLKKKFIAKDPPRVSVTTFTAPDGTPLLVVKQEEK